MESDGAGPARPDPARPDPARPAGGAFLHRTVPCPVCRKGAPNRSIKSKSYEFVEIEPDRYPRVVRWRDPALQAVRPNHYHFWACANCGYVDEGESFRTRAERGEAPAGVAAIVRQAPPAVALLRGWLDLAAPRYDFRTALGIHMLGLCVQDALGAVHRDAVLRASLSLRAAWLYRELDGLGVAGARGAALAADLVALCSAWPEAPLDERACLHRAAESYRAQYDLTRGGADVRRDVTLLLLIGEIRRRAGEAEAASGALRLASQALLGAGAGRLADAPWRERALEEMRELRQRLGVAQVQSPPS